MPVIWWNGPDKGPGSVEDVTSHTREVVGAIHDAAEDLRDTAAAILETGLRNNSRNASIKVMHHGDLRLGHRSKLDSVVYLEASDVVRVRPGDAPYTEEDYQRAAASIEYLGVGPLWHAVGVMDRGIQ